MQRRSIGRQGSWSRLEPQDVGPDEWRTLEARVP